MCNCENIHFPCCRLIFIIMQQSSQHNLLTPCMKLYSFLTHRCRYELNMQYLYLWVSAFITFFTVWTYACHILLPDGTLTHHTSNMWLLISPSCGRYNIYTYQSTWCLIPERFSLYQNWSQTLIYFAQHSYCYQTFRINDSASHLLNKISSCNMQEDQTEMMKIGPVYLPSILNMLLLQHSAS